MTDPFLLLVGPTAVGKTEASYQVAEALDAEIVSVDSRQIYREIDIGTAKPSSEELERVPHHFIDELDLDESISAGQYSRAAEERMAKIVSCGRMPLIVGGSTLYIRALKEGLADIPDVPEQVREEMKDRLKQEGREALYDELQAVDPKAAGTLDATKTQRLVRALEVYHGTGKPLTYYHEHQPEPAYSYVTVVLNRNRKKLHERIGRRVDQMLEMGLLDEVRRLRAQGHAPENTQALRSIGYKEPMAYLADEIDYEEMVRLLKRNTRRYAKRQITWFRRDPENNWLMIKEDDTPEETAQVILEVFRRGS